MLSLTLAQAVTIVDEALAEAGRRKAAPLCVAVLDAGGHLIALKREDKASLLRPQIAVAKAKSVLGMGLGGRELANRAASMPAFFANLSALTYGAMVPAPGGILLRDDEGDIVGAVGISGDTSEIDEICGLVGIRATRLKPDAGTAPAS
jgi:uncharacterized protein GlcG (DUF336 family)